MPSTIPSPPSLADGQVSVDFRDGVASIRFHHPKGNSLPATILRRLADEVTRLGEDEATRVIVLRSEGTGSFCAGASFDELQRITDRASGKEFFLGFARLILAMRGCPKFIISRVHGRAVGGGVGIIAASDYAVATASSAVRLSELAIGIGPFVVGPVIEKKIGLGAFATMAIDTDWHDAAWAGRCGLYSRVHDNIDELDSCLGGLTRRLAGSNPEAMARMKAVFWQGTEHWDRLLEDRAEMSGTLVLSEFTRAAIASFNAR
jgi:enoyl-CoA hydratase/carnithine racemase